MFRPSACTALTRAGVNCAQKFEPPSELFTYRVLIPAACACAAMLARSPPLEALRYQIHIPAVANGELAGVVSVTDVGTGAGGGLGGSFGGAGRTLIGP